MMPPGGTEESQRDAEELGSTVEALQARNADKFGLLVPRQIERLAGVSQGTVHNLWTGQVWPQHHTVLRLSRAFGLRHVLEEQ